VIYSKRERERERERERLYLHWLSGSNEEVSVRRVINMPVFLERTLTSRIASYHSDTGVGRITMR